MSSQIDKILITFALVLLGTNSFSQSSFKLPKLNLSVGYLQTKITEPTYLNRYIYYDFKTENGSGYSISMLVDFPISKFNISLGSSYSSGKNTLLYESRPLVDQGMWRTKKEVKMSYLNFRVLLKYYPFNWLNIHSGFRLSFPQNHQARTLEIEAISPEISVPTDYTFGIWKKYENFDIQDVNVPMGLSFGSSSGPFISFDYYLGLVDISKRIEELYGQKLWGDQKRNSFEVSIGWKFDFNKNSKE